MDINETKGAKIFINLEERVLELEEKVQALINEKMPNEILENLKRISKMFP
jgi:hypothetical protein